MLRITSGLMLILLTACSGSDTARPVPASSPTATAAPPAPAPATLPAAVPDILVPINPSEKSVSPAEKLAARALATDLMKVMQSLEGVVDDSTIMNDTTRYGRYFYSVIDPQLVRWQKLADASQNDPFGNLGYCREAGQALASLGQMVHAKSFGQQFLDERRSQYAEAFPKCQLALRSSS
ncbi:hypothetical protein [Janthinobacterium sp. PSPC2-1]|uniref:hypothetical protein n=1 Tax=unclassified Janthinobacterium TaxID=2610881 RepID=UPI003CF35ACE